MVRVKSLLVFLAISCGTEEVKNGQVVDDSTVTQCVPGITQECLCVDGQIGVQSCRDDGSGYIKCECLDTSDTGEFNGTDITDTGSDNTEEDDAGPAICSGPSTKDCGLCGVQTRTCDNGTWNEWSSCTGQGDCVPDDEANCGCGSRFCEEDCTWSACFEPACCNSSDCTDGKQCQNGDCICVAEYEKKCSGGDSWWFDSCGKQDSKADDCNNQEECQNGTCVDKSCSEACTGCCDSSTCQFGSTASYCGSGGAACKTCKKGWECSNGVCTCNDQVDIGCFEGDAWWFDCEGQLSYMEENCAGGSTCSSATDSCECSPEETFACHPNGNLVWKDSCGNWGDNYQGCDCGCSGTSCKDCGPACPNGSCEAGETKCSCPSDCGSCSGCCSSGSCQTGNSDSSCGSSGGACSSCTGGKVCQSGSCQCKAKTTFACHPNGNLVWKDSCGN
ncbi:MAG: hypothetical protein QME66_12655, partial [Candidatus Eisenbacteria bacterium]|nr:hypothetical protein [Candidatus Eisenbacteria bacterium]